MPYMTIRQIKHQLCLSRLRDLGCKVISVQGVMFYVKCLICNFEITYVYHINDDNTYYLERLKPYLVSAGTFKSEEDVVKSIEVDIHQFENAIKSKNFSSFIDIDKELSGTVRAFDDLFLYYNISKDDIELIKNQIYKINDTLKKVKNRSERVFFEKDPENI